MSTVFILIHGSNKHSPARAFRAGWQYGVCSKDKAYARCYMIDYDWTDDTDESWKNYLALCAEHKPAQSVVIDLERPEQELLMQQRIADVLSLNITPVVVPKFPGAVAKIPASAIVGISVPTRDLNSDKFSVWLPDASEVSGRKLHLLGGHPDQWNWLRVYYRGNEIVSIDGNAMIRKARRGQFWRKNSWGYRDVRKQGFSTEAMAIYSMKNAVRYWHSQHINHICKRVIDCKQDLRIIPVQMSMFAA